LIGDKTFAIDHRISPQFFFFVWGKEMSVLSSISKMGILFRLLVVKKKIYKKEITEHFSK
jgi:hypothetical protein